MSMRVEFTTRPFVQSHGREPCGASRGSWAFQFGDNRETWFAPSALTLTQAKAAARVEAARRAGAGGVFTIVKILP